MSRYGLPSRMPSCGWFLTILLPPLCLAPAHATRHGNDTGWSASTAYYHQNASDLDDGGDAGVQRRTLYLSARRRASPQLQLGLDLRFGRDTWDFHAPAAFGGIAPWRTIRHAGATLRIERSWRNDWIVFAAPTVRYAGERGAESGDAMAYGIAFGAVKVYGEDRRLGVGLAVMHDIDKTRVLPFPIVSWRIDEHWRLGNPDSGSPSGAVGMELGYANGSRWTFGLGAGFQRERFRLDADGATAGGIGESRAIPVYARLGLQACRTLRLDFYAGMALKGRLQVDSPGQRSRAAGHYGSTPMLGLALNLGL